MKKYYVVIACTDIFKLSVRFREVVVSYSDEITDRNLSRFLNKCNKKLEPFMSSAEYFKNIVSWQEIKIAKKAIK